MGYRDHLARLQAKVMSEFGQVVTYTPADPAIEPFETTGVVDLLNLDQVERNILRDECECRIAHSSLAAYGITKPMAEGDRTTGDRLSFAGMGGEVEEWLVVQVEADQDLQEWVISLERSLRFIPT